MNTLSWIVDVSFSTRLTVSLLHFLWQGIAGGVLVIVAGWVLRGGSARSRYALNVAVLFLMAACLPVTFSLVESSNAIPDQSARIQSRDESAAFPLLNSEDQTSSGTIDIAKSDEILISPNLVPENAEALIQTGASKASTIGGDSSSAAVFIANAFPTLSRWVAVIYLTGVMLILGRLLLGVWGGHRLRRMSNDIQDSALLGIVAKLAHRLGLKRVPTIARCQQISIPVVVGVMKPIILLPMAVLSGLTPDQVQALILHELSHIRRFDPVVNLLQRIIEAVLFFHPVVWFVSRRISIERELAADDMVLAAGWDRPLYAEALVRVAELASTITGSKVAGGASVLGASGSSESEFKQRVLRLLEVSHSPKMQLSRTGVLAMLLVFAVGGVFAWSQTVKSDLAADRSASVEAVVPLPDQAIANAQNGQDKLANENVSHQPNQVTEVRVPVPDGSPINHRGRANGESEPESGDIALTMADVLAAKTAEIDPNGEIVGRLIDAATQPAPAAKDEQGANKTSRSTDHFPIPQSVDEFEKLLRGNDAKLAEGRLELSLDYEWLRPTKENPKRIVSTQGTMRRIRKGKLLRIDFNRLVANPSVMESNHWPESWVTGFDGDLEYSWMPEAKFIAYGELRSESRSLDYWGFPRSELPWRTTESQIQVNRELREGHQIWDVRIEDQPSNFVFNYIGVRPDRNYLPSRIEVSFRNEPYSRTEFQDLFEPQPGVWVARTMLVDAFYLNRPAKREGYTANRTKTTITRLELGDAAGLKDGDFVLKVPKGTQVRKWEGIEQRVTPAGFCQATLHFVGGQNLVPLNGLQVEITHGDGERQKMMGSFTTDAQGTVEVRLPAAFYSLHLNSDKELPYLPVEKLWDGQTRGPRPDLSVNLKLTGPEKWLGGKRHDDKIKATSTDAGHLHLTYTLLTACELVLRAVDAETGKGIAGVEFYEENAAGEEWAHPIFGENVGSKFVEKPQDGKRTSAWLTDRDGYFKRLVGANDGYKYGVVKPPAGYVQTEPNGDVEVKIVFGQRRAEQLFKFIRNKTTAATERQPRITIEKVAQQQALIDQPFVYSIIVKNTGSVDAHNIVIEDRIPKGTELLGTAPQTEISGKRLIWNQLLLKPNEEKKFSIKVIPRQQGAIGSVARVHFATEATDKIVVAVPQQEFLVKAPSEVRVVQPQKAEKVNRNHKLGDDDQRPELQELNPLAAKLETEVRLPPDSDGRSETPDHHFRVSFNEAPWNEILLWYGRVIGKPIEMKVVPEGTFSYQSPRPLNDVEIIQLINGELLSRNCCLVERGDGLSVQPAEVIARQYSEELRKNFMNASELRKGSDKFDAYFEIVDVRVVGPTKPPIPSGPAIAYVLKANRVFSAQEAAKFLGSCFPPISIPSLKTGQHVVADGFAVLHDGEWSGEKAPALQKGERIEVWQNRFGEWNARPPSDMRVIIKGRIIGHGDKPVSARIRQFLMEGGDGDGFRNWAFGGELIVDEQGRFEVLLGHGTQYVRTAYLYAFASGYAPQRVGPFQVSYDKPAEQLTIELKPGFPARIRLIGADGKPLEKGAVEVTAQDDLQSEGIPILKSMINGKPISITNCPAGPISLKVRLPGVAEQEIRDVRLTPDQEFEIKLK